MPANQTMLISSIRLGAFADGLGGGMVNLAGLVVLNGVTNTVQFSDPGGGSSISGVPCALNGPCQIAFVVGWGPYQPTAVVVSYRFLQNSLVHSLLAPPNSTNVITVSAGKEEHPVYRLDIHWGGLQHRIWKHKFPGWNKYRL